MPSLASSPHGDQGLVWYTFVSGSRFNVWMRSPRLTVLSRPFSAAASNARRRDSASTGVAVGGVVLPGPWLRISSNLPAQRDREGTGRRAAPDRDCGDTLAWPLWAVLCGCAAEEVSTSTSTSRGITEYSRLLVNKSGRRAANPPFATNWMADALALGDAFCTEFGASLVQF